MKWLGLGFRVHGSPFAVQKFLLQGRNHQEQEHWVFWSAKHFSNFGANLWPYLSRASQWAPSLQKKLPSDCLKSSWLQGCRRSFPYMLCRGVKLPSRRPALVSESCLHSQDGSRRVRAFIVLDPRGVLDVIGFFTEKKIEGAFVEVENNVSEVIISASYFSVIGYLSVAPLSLLRSTTLVLSLQCFEAQNGSFWTKAICN